MNIPKTCKIELAASTDRTRLCLNEPYLDIKDGKGNLVATDGRRCVVIPVELSEKDVAGYVSSDVLQAARKLASKTLPASVELNGSATFTNGMTMPRNGAAEGQGNYPNWRQVVPTEELPHKIAFNVRWLYECAQAMGAETVVLQFSNPNSPIVLTPQGVSPVPGAKAVLMPIRCS